MVLPLALPQLFSPLTAGSGSIVSAFLEISSTWHYFSHVKTKRSTPGPPGRQAAQMRYTSGAAAVSERGRNGNSANHNGVKMSQIRYLCAPKCGIFFAAGTIWPQKPAFCAASPSKMAGLSYKSKLYQQLGWCTGFPYPKLYLELTFPPPNLARPPWRGLISNFFNFDFEL